MDASDLQGVRAVVDERERLLLRPQIAAFGGGEYNTRYLNRTSWRRDAIQDEIRTERSKYLWWGAPITGDGDAPQVEWFLLLCR